MVKKDSEIINIIEEIGCEVGNFDTKLVAANMIDIKEDDYKDKVKPVAILNMVSTGQDRRTYGNDKVGGKARSLVNLLDVTIEAVDSEACGRWFVGGLAFKVGKKIIKPNKNTKKSESPQTIIMMLTTIAYYLFDPNNPIKTKRIKLSTLLPSEEYAPKKISNKDVEDKDYVDIFSKKLIGKHKIIFNDPAFLGAEITIEIEDLSINPEGAVAQIASIYNWEGQIKKEFQGLENKIIMNIDFGSIDTNVSILEDGEFVDDGIFGFKGGTVEVLKQISQDIESSEGVLIDTFKIDFHIRSKRPIFAGDKDITELLDKLKEERYKQAGWAMANDVNEQLSDRGIDTNGISIIGFSGGGSQFFRKSVEPKVKGVQTKITEPKNARFANAEGACKQLVFDRYSSEEESKDIFED